MKNLFEGLSGYLSRLSLWSLSHPGTVFLSALLIAFVSIAYTALRLDFKTSRNDLVASSEPAVQRFEEISEDFGRLTNVIVVVEGKDLEQMKNFARLLAERLKQEPQYFGNILYRINTETLEGKKLLFLSPEDLQNLKDKLEEYGELIEELAFEPSLATIFQYVNQKISEATVSHLVGEFLGKGEGKENKQENAETTRKPVDLSFLRELLTEMRLSLEPGYQFHSPWDTFFKASKKFSYDGFLVSDDERFLYITLEARSQADGFTKKKAALDRLRWHIKELRKKGFEDLSVGVTGGVALATDEMVQAMKDTQLATAVAAIGIALLFMIVFHQVYNPLMVVTTLVISIAWTLGWLTLTVGSLNILSVAFVPILMGLGVDFGIHLVARYSEERQKGADVVESMKISADHTGRAITVGAITTALAFFSLMLARFRGIQELGFIAGSGVLLALVATFTVFPAMLKMVESRSNPGTGHATALRINISSEKLVTGHSKLILLIWGVLTVCALAGLSRVRFDYNLLKLQARGTESVVWEEKIIGESGRSSWFAVTTARDLVELRKKHRAFEELPSVRKVDSLADMLPEDQNVRISLVRDLAPYVPNIELEEINPSGDDPAELLDILEKIKFKLRSDTRWDPTRKPDDREIESTREALILAIEGLKKRLESMETVKSLHAFEKKLFDDFLTKFTLLKNNVNPPGPIEEKDIPPELLARFKGKSGRYLLQIYSRENIWEKEHMENFVKELETVDPSVTGSPVVGYIAISTMQQGYIEGSIYALCVIFVVIIATFRRISLALVSCIPLAGTIVLMLGLMGWTGIPFNLANLITLPLILGIAVDDGVHIMHRYSEKQGDLHETFSGGLTRAVSLTSWTTMIGFGSLMLAHHYGIFTLGLLVTVSVGIAWILSLFGLPAILQILSKGGTETR
ncbi:MMPL family transporter [Thermodesulforhabdus norvegica]|uniref:SSD domain-containing protein n=1 Tax=Thermodesulforhabdus norvegica TaxID=39841 RepID=A0A1I4RAF9_9BACT|nr:MMPL family transporter [Thermodesulforhabdus norvegica]SFM48960.1 hypothetical protein SAMN05660836_00490 [Thermodesulforhabdus norvegica]